MPATTTNGLPLHGWPQDVGILAMDIYFPNQYVDQAELETYDGVSNGKYTVGLGQTRMGFCSDVEDVSSLCLSVVDKLLRKTGTPPERVGRLEVGTETLVDKSKSVKSVLMQLFPANSDMEGVDSTNACYGGTAALFNSLAWVESSAWDGRLALAVCADIAVYAEGAARPSGGAGAVAMLIGPHAPLVFDRGVRSSHMQHVYDFYKPHLSSEYPVVDAKLSIQSYLSALDHCYRGYRQKAETKLQENICLESFDGVLFHTPYCKLVQKSLARLSLNDFLSELPEDRLSRYPELAKFQNTKLEESYFDREVEKAFMSHSEKLYVSKTKPSLKVATNVGNMYTPSLYGGLIGHMMAHSIEELAGQKIGMFSYGSGLASSFFSLRISSDTSSESSLHKFLSYLSDVEPNLEKRMKVVPQGFVSTLELREQSMETAPYSPKGLVSDLRPGTWYLSDIDDKCRRTYLKAKDSSNTNGHSKND